MTTLTVREYGSFGPTVILLNGAGSALAQIERLAEALAPRYRVLVPAFPGYGATPRFGETYTMAIDRALLREALAVRGMRRIHAVVGLSLGAFRAVLLALEGVVVVERLIGLAPALVLSPEERAGFGGIADLLRQGGPLPLAAIVQSQLSTRYRAAHPHAAEQLGGWISTIDPQALADELGMAVRELPQTIDRELELVAASVRKILFRFGREDRSATTDRISALAKPIDAEVQIVEGAAHLLLVEDFEGTLLAITDVLATPV